MIFFSRGKFEISRYVCYKLTIRDGGCKQCGLEDVRDRHVLRLVEN